MLIRLNQFNQFIVPTLDSSIIIVSKTKLDKKNKSMYTTNDLSTNQDTTRNKKNYNFAFGPAAPAPTPSSFAFFFNSLLKIFPLALFGISFTKVTPPLSLL